MKRLLLLTAALAVVALPATAAPKAKSTPAAVAKPAEPPKPTAADWRVPDPNNVLVIDTNKGRVIVEMFPELAPNHVQRIRELALAHFYDGLTFFRVIADFMDQTGDPKNNGTGGSEKPDLAQEFFFRRDASLPFTMAEDQSVAEIGFVKSAVVKTQSMMLAAMTKDGKVAGTGLFCKGVAGMARGGEPDSANSQFFLMRANYPALDGRYTVWGRLLSGQETVMAIKVGEPVADPQDKMERVRLLADLPEGQRPKIRVINTQGAWFKGEIARERAEKGANFSACDVNIPAEVK